ncbi:uncharacterized protein LOC131939982 isoform X2 [Physella acuta]|uniref:uncharacterized protein LOC131939982 isoform X2 n=1 Tax=Physella acuta TaxID=109671 RepID=UPI0027DC5B2E|nr:uncharacterized protein LOC131939982 isoform X2 [Physella acuta]
MAIHSEKPSNGFASVLLFIVTVVILDITMANKKGLYFQYIGNEANILKLRCHVGMLSSDNTVVSIIIYNGTAKEKMAYVMKEKEPTLERKYADGTFFLAGGISGDSYHPASLEILMLRYESTFDQTFICNVTLMLRGADFQFLSWTVVINRTGGTTLGTTTTPGPFTEAPYRVGPVKEKEIDAESLPMTVLIVMLVLISILLFLAVFLLLHRYRSRCMRRDEELYRPPAYCLAPEHHLDWTDSSTIKSKGSARTLNSRSHYSIAAHHMHMPLPPIPHSPRRNKTYRRPPSVGSSVRVPYVQPQDAIGQESSEDGEIAALSSGSPKVHYKSPRDRPTRQNSPLYACVPVSSTDE